MYKVSGKPDSIGQYLTIDLTRDILGVSSTGYVIRTSCSDGQPASSRPCALKRIQTTDDKPPDLARLSHENVVQLVHYWTEERDLFLVMELMDGNLAMLMEGIERAEASPFFITVAVDIMLQIAKGMLYLHETGFSHPQLKCENVLYKLVNSKTEAFGLGDMVVKLGGFGCSMRADEKSKRRDVECFGRTCLEILAGVDLSLVTDICGAHRVSIMAELSRIPESTPGIVKVCIETCLSSKDLTFSDIVRMFQEAKSYVMQTCKGDMTYSSVQTRFLQSKAKDDSLSVNTSIVGLEEIFAVHQLHPLPGDSYKPARATLIFFHGFHKVPGEWKRTWMTRDNKVIWPQKWLPEDLGEENIRVYSVSFDANSNVSNKYNRFEMGKNLVQRLVLSPRWKLGENFEKAIFLVGHSFGGVLIKSLVTGARSFIDERVGNCIDQQEVRMCENFLKNLVKIVFYSVPHGAPAAVNFELYISECRMISALQRSSFLQSLREDIHFGADMNKLSADFERAVPEKMDILAFLEGKPMSKRLVLVTKNSCEGITDNGISWKCHKIDKDNHFEVCRPDSKNHAGYKILLNHLQQHMSAPYGLTSTLSESYSYNEVCKECAKIGSTNCKDHEERQPEVSVLEKRHIHNYLSKAFWQPSEKRRKAAPFSHVKYSMYPPFEKINQEIKDQGEDVPGDLNAKVLTKDGSMNESNRSDISTATYVSSEISGESRISREQVSARQDMKTVVRKTEYDSERNLRKYVVEFRPRRFKWNLWMGTYATVDEAWRASDCVRFYTGEDKGGFHFKDSPSLFAELGPLNRPFALVSKFVKDNAFNVELKKRAKEVIRKVLDANTDKRSLSYTRQPTVKYLLPDAILQSSDVFGGRTSTSSDSTCSLRGNDLAGSLQQEVANTAPEAGDALKYTESFTNFDPSSDYSLSKYINSPVLLYPNFSTMHSEYDERPRFQSYLDFSEDFSKCFDLSFVEGKSGSIIWEISA